MWESIREELRIAGEQTTTSLGELLRAIPELLVAALVVVVFAGAARVARRLIRTAGRLPQLDPMLRGLLDQLITVGIIAFGVAIALRVLGIDARTIVASFGVAGLIVGFALKDLLENFIAGILILWHRPFRVADQIRIGVNEGIVEAITFRTTALRTPDGVQVLVPNAQILTQAVHNLTHLGARRSTVVLKLPPEVDVERAREALDHAVRGVAGVLASPAPETLLLGLDPDGYELHLRYWTAPDTETAQRVESAVRCTALATLVQLRETAAATGRDGERT
ncbi:MAG: mechanosensitive ion channel family protein [Sphaerobacter sp.]|nr:mechanosensitive ion channel family protein [Sphaerobacter sp.]